MLRLEMEPQAEIELKRALEKDPRDPARQLPARPDRALQRPVGRGGDAQRAGTGGEPRRRDGALSARRRPPAGVTDGRGPGGAAEIPLAQPVLQRPVHPPRTAVSQEGSSRRPPRACCAAPFSTIRTIAPRTTCSASSCSRPDGRRKPEKSSPSPSRSSRPDDDGASKRCLLGRGGRARSRADSAAAARRAHQLYRRRPRRRTRCIQRSMAASIASDSSSRPTAPAWPLPTSIAMAGLTRSC